VALTHFVVAQEEHPLDCGKIGIFELCLQVRLCAFGIGAAQGPHRRGRTEAGTTGQGRIFVESRIVLRPHALFAVRQEAFSMHQVDRASLEAAIAVDEHRLEPGRVHVHVDSRHGPRLVVSAGVGGRGDVQRARRAEIGSCSPARARRLANLLLLIASWDRGHVVATHFDRVWRKAVVNDGTGH
jgi:hypothetical protein